MVRTTNITDEDMKRAAAEEAMRKRAARQAAKRDLEPSSRELVECTVLPAGHEKISMGHHVGGLGEVHYEEDETFKVELPIALALYKRGYVNFEGARETMEKANDVVRAQATQEMADKLALAKAVELAGL